MNSETNLILYSVADSVARLTLNRPEKRNALNDQLIEQLKSSLKKANEDAAVSAVVITGAGKDFCSGADLASLQKISESSVNENAADARTV